MSTFFKFSLHRLKACEQRRSELFAKQGRGQQFASVDERDTWIRRVSFTQNTVIHLTFNKYVSPLRYIQEILSLSESLEHKQKQVKELIHICTLSVCNCLFVCTCCVCDLWIVTMPCMSCPR